MKDIVISVVLILAAAIPGAWLAWVALTALGLSGVPLAVLSAVLAMVLATALYAVFTSALRSLGWSPGK